MINIAKKLITNIFNQGGVTFNGPNPWDIQIKDPRFFKRILKHGSVGFGESYMDGDWDVSQLDELIRRMFRVQANRKPIFTINRIWHDLKSRVINLQTLHRSRAVIDTHYDLDQRLYQHFMGPYNQYSCCFFNKATTLAEAEIEKLEMICNKLDLQPGDKVLDIGCGWGGFARYAAETRGCHVTGISISQEQITYAKNFTAGLSVEILNADYRDLPKLFNTNHFDKVVIIGMIEHVGYKNYRHLFDIIHKIINNDGLFLLHTIGNTRKTTITDPWIEKYIFRNSMLPSMSHLTNAAEQLFIIQDWENYGHYYAQTLIAWQHNFEKNWEVIKAIESKNLFDERFRRMFNFYFKTCQAGFETENLLLWQIVMSKQGVGKSVYRRVNLLSSAINKTI
jgi:cyclopropane-fatty-acyl-phospholipid synthase|uniref:cyclopropane fatty acyl phospholipid synthase n=1 Tax=Orrella sp. TaxID=1921583 RepID=UPI0040485E97